MKKYISFFAFAVMMVAAGASFAACGDDDDDDDAVVPKTEQEARKMFLGTWLASEKMQGAAADMAEGLYMRFLPDGTYNLIIKLKKSFGGKYFYDGGKWTYSIVPDAENPAQGKILFDQNNMDACVGYYRNLSSQSFELLNRRDFNDTKFHKFKKKDVNINEDNTTHTLPELLD